MQKKIVIASDHGGYKLKEFLKDFLESDGFLVEDTGCYSLDSCDYPDFGHKAALKVDQGEYEKGIVICTTGIGMSILANRHKNVRAALCYNEEAAEMTRLHNNANILALGAKFVSEDEALKIMNVFLHTEFEGGRHIRRVNKINPDYTCPLK